MECNTPAARYSKQVCHPHDAVVVCVHRFNRVKGMVTRKDLLGYKLDEAVQVCCWVCPAASTCAAAAYEHAATHANVR